MTVVAGTDEGGGDPGSGDSGGDGDGGNPGGDFPPGFGDGEDSEAGCGCFVGGQPSDGRAAVLMLLGLVPWLRRRR